MDRQRARRGAVAALLLLCTPAPAWAQGAALRAAEWLAPGTDAVAALTTRPPECLAVPGDPEAALSVEIGRAAFRTPLLLGGQGARAGLSCNSCHINGHGNPDFLFPGLSGAPGTADVTSSVMSEVRGDGVANPKPIPTLTVDAASLDPPLVSRDGGGELELFIHGLVVEEFAGDAAPDAAIAGLADYVRGLSSDICAASRASEPITLAADMEDARRALAAAQRLLQSGDGTTAALMLAAARSALGAIDERFAGLDFVAEREALRRAASELGEVRELARTDPRAAHAALLGWPQRLADLQTRLRPEEARSLYAPEVLARAMRE